MARKTYVPSPLRKGMDAPTKMFACANCGFEIRGPSIAISMTIDCPNCEDHTTAYK